MSDAHKRMLEAIDNAAPPPDAPPATPPPKNGKKDRKRDEPRGRPSGAAGADDADERIPDPRFTGGNLEYSDLDLKLSQKPCTDLGNAERFIARHGHDFLYVPEWGWMAWDGSRWNGQEAEAILGNAVKDTVRAIRAEAIALSESGQDMVVDHKKDRDVWASDRVMGWWISSQANGHVTCIANLARSELTVPSSVFDRDPYAINCLNGTVRIDRNSPDGQYVKLHPHRREDRISRIAAVHYNPEATAPVYDKFLARVQPSPEMRRHLHAWGGLSLTALQVPRLHFWYGTGRNGKSTLSDVWAHVMGDYARTVGIETFLDTGRARRGGEASPDLAGLPNIRFLRTSEPERGATLAENMIKLVTGGEAIQARHLNKDFFEFLPVFKLTMQGNYKPKVLGTDEGIWSRVLLIPWRVIIPKEERDAALPAKLRAEGSGIFNRLLDGLCDYIDHGLNEPEEALEATREYREQSDPMGRFLDECTDRSDKDAKAGARPLYELYVAWAKADGETVWSPKGVSRSLQEHGIARKKADSIWYVGVRLTKLPIDFVEHEVPDASEKIE